MNPFSDVVKQKSNDELLQMAYEFDEWSPEMLGAVEIELHERDLLPTDISSRRKKMIDEEEERLKEGKEASMLGLVIGWLTIFGFIGFYMGWRYGYSKVNSKYTKKRYYAYNEGSRKNGTYILYVSILCLIGSIVYAIINANGAGL